MANKVTFGIKNVHYAVADNSGGSPTYDTPKPIPGAVSIGLDALGETTLIYADDILYWTCAANSGYQGPFECMAVPDDFRIDVLGDTLSGNGLLVENVEAIPKQFALMFEFDGDEAKRRVVLYNCSVQRPSISSTTNTATKTPNQRSMQITASPRADGIVRAFTTDTTDSNVYSNWYNSVQVPTASTLPKLTGLSIGSYTLTPTFSSDTTVYGCTASGSSATITATAASGVAIAVIVNGNSIANGGTATWVTGSNLVEVRASKDGVTNSYFVEVTKS